MTALEKYRANITEAANAKCFSADLLTGFISRVTNGGQDLDGSLGWIPCHNNPSQQCFGIMNLCKDRTPVTTDGFGGVEYLKHGISILIEQIDQIVLNHPDWNSGLFSKYLVIKLDDYLETNLSIPNACRDFCIGLFRQSC